MCEDNVCTLITNCFCVHWRVILVFISLVVKHQNNPLVSAQTVHSSTYIILYILGYAVTH